MHLIVEGESRVSLLGTATVVEEGRELAWAEAHIRKSPDIKWILGNYLQTATEENPTFNSNGHSFPYEDMRDAIHDIPHRPLNLNHLPGRRIGTFTAAEFVWPNGEEAGEAAPAIVEALAVYWHYYEPEQWPAIEMAYKEGQLFFSMESVPEEVTCRGNATYGGCGQTFEYAGRTSKTYCDHLNEPRARKTLHHPHFTAGALIVPPVRPGWKQADIKEISNLLEDPQAETLYNEVANETSHLGPQAWERITAYLLNVR